eukprot:gnl/MRDRNA2_/MRDRNA2_137698_c0_seq1.p1 gnl/MRDRNA2_/MRDRNA2_137698_c0~~gnl/MRDRNA2_/MRDRNA2_137698_c0_seq1.p1  ORF type:complete len:518 (-),score=139.62 gnl/MRDRNA2_/MRDRNA2_137698_c0_seq1:7-1560(-)
MQDAAPILATSTVVRKLEGNHEVPDAKRLKGAVDDAEAGIHPLRKQVEYYLSDKNLTHDKFFHEKISSNPEGWLDLNLILSCAKMKKMLATKETVLAALVGSEIEIMIEEDGTAIRRPGNRPLPKYVVKEKGKGKGKKGEKVKYDRHEHDGGVVMMVNVVKKLKNPQCHLHKKFNSKCKFCLKHSALAKSEEESWQEMEGLLRAKLPAGVDLIRVSVGWKNTQHTGNQSVVAVTSFPGDKYKFDHLLIEGEGITWETEVCYGELLAEALALLPKEFLKARQKAAKAKRQGVQSSTDMVDTESAVDVDPYMVETESAADVDHEKRSFGETRDKGSASESDVEDEIERYTSSPSSERSCADVPHPQMPKPVLQEVATVQSVTDTIPSSPSNIEDEPNAHQILKDEKQQERDHTLGNSSGSSCTVHKAAVGCDKSEVDTNVLGGALAGWLMEEENGNPETNAGDDDKSSLVSVECKKSEVDSGVLGGALAGFLMDEDANSNDEANAGESHTAELEIVDFF